MKAKVTLPPKRTLAGFTLIELMTVLAVATILLSIGIPSFRALLQNLRITSTANGFFAAMNLTRSEALKRGMPVHLSTVDGGIDWSKGWVVFVDSNGTGQLDEGDEVIFKRDQIPNGMTIDPKFTSKTVKYLTYNGSGRTQINGSNSAPQAGSFLITLDNQIERKIVINFLGRARVCNPLTESATC